MEQTRIRTRTTISISISFFVSVILFIISLVMIFKNGIGLFHYYHPTDFSDMNMSALRSGNYVECTIDQYVVKSLAPNSPNRYTGVSHSISKSTFGGLYDVYTIPMADGNYIRIMINDKQVIDRLESFTKGAGEPVSVIGVVKKNKDLNTPDDLSWYEGVEDFDTDLICSDYVIEMAKSVSDMKNGLLSGIFILIFATLLYWYKGRIEQDEKIIQDKDYEYIYAHSYNNDNELSLEIEHIIRLEKRQNTMKKWAFVGALCFGYGIYLFIRIVQKGEPVTTIFLAFILFLVIFGIKKMWDYFKNSNMRLAKKIASLFEWKTLPKEKEETRKKIDAIMKQKEK